MSSVHPCPWPMAPPRRISICRWVRCPGEQALFRTNSRRPVQYASNLAQPARTRCRFFCPEDAISCTDNQFVAMTAVDQREEPSIGKRVLRGRVGLSSLGVGAAALTLWASFHAGGYFPDAVGAMAVALAVAATLRITLAPRPFAGFGAHAVVVLALGSLLLTWTLLSSSWSSAPAWALLEGNRTLLYLLAFAFAASFARQRTSLAVLLRWVLAAFVVVALAALASRLFGDVVHVTAGR